MSLHPLPGRWDWRISAHWRAASLASAWLLVLAMPFLGWAFDLGAGLRSAASLAQTILNIRLGKRDSMGRSTRVDWLLMGSIIAAVEIAAVIGRITDELHTPLNYTIILLPFTALQVRMCARSYRAAARAERRLLTFERRVLADEAAA